MEISVEHYNKMAERLTELEYILAEQPEIIRCGECKHYVDGYIHCNRVTWYNSEDDFCSRAERR